MKTTLALVLLVAVSGCKGKEAAPKEVPVAKAAEPAPATPAVAPATPAAPAAAATGPITDALDQAVQCLGFVNGGNGAYLVTRGRDAQTKTLDLVAVGDAENPKLEAMTEQFEDANAKKELAPAIAKMNAFVAGKQLAPCTEWKKSGDAWKANVGGGEVTLKVKGTKLTVTVGGKVTIEKDIEGGADHATIETAFSSGDMNNIAVVVNATAEAMSKYQVVWVAVSANK